MDNKKEQHLLNTKQQEMSKHGILKKPLIVGPPLNQVTSRIRVISPRVKPATHYSRVVANILCDRPCNDPLPFKDVYSDRLGLSIFKNTLHGDPEFRDYTYKKYGSQFRVKELFPCSGYPSWDLYGSDGDKYNAFRLPNRNECIGNEDCWLPQYTKEYVEKLKWTGGCGLLANADFQRGFQMNRGCPGSGMNPDGTCKSVAQLTELTKAKRLYDWVRGPDGKVHKRPVGAYTDLGTSASAESMGRYGGRGGAANRFYNKKGMGGAHGKFVSRSDTRLDKRGPGGARVMNYRTGQQGHAQGKGHHQQQQHHPHHYKKHGMQHGHHGHNVTVYKMDNVSVDGSGDSGPDDGLKRKSNTRNRNNKRSPNRYRSDRSYPSRPSRTQLKPDRSPSRSRNNKENIMEKYFADGKSRRDLTSSHVKEHKGALKSPDSRHGINSKHASRTGIGGQKRNVGGGRGRDGPGKATFQKGGGAGRGYGGGGKGYGGGGKGYGGGGKGYGGGGKGYGGGKGHAGGGRYDNDKNSYGGRPESGGGHSYGKGGKPGAGATGYDGKLRKSKQEEGGDHIPGRGGKPGESLPTDSRGSITGLNRTRRPVKGTTSGLLNPNLSYHVRPSSKGGRYKTMKEGRERHHHQVWDGEGYGSEFRGDSDEEGEYIEREEDKELLAVNMCWEMASRVFKKPSKALVVPSADNLMLYLEMKYPKSSWGRGEPIASRQYPNGSTFVAQYANGASRVYYPHGGLAMAISGPSPETSQILIIRDPSDHMFFFDKAVLADLNTAGKGIIYGEDGVIKVQYSTIGGFKIQEGLEHGQRWHWHQGGQRMLLKLNKFVSLRLSDFDKIFLNYNGNRRGFLVNVATGYSVSLMNLERTFDTVLVELRNLIRPRTADDGHFDFEHGRFVLPRPPLQFVGTMFSDTESHKALC